MWQLAVLFLAFQKAPEPATKHPKEIELLVDRARGVALEFTADLLLRLAGSPRVTDAA